MSLQCIECFLDRGETRLAEFIVAGRSVCVIHARHLPAFDANKQLSENK
jgi:hypothetical protein